MTSSDVSTPVFDVRANGFVNKPPEAVYAIVSDLPRCGEWSIECTGGEWIQGKPGAIGSVFRGHNVRSADVVGWAPVVRGEWSTTAQVVQSEPGRHFSWAMRDSAGRVQASVWGFDIEPHGTGSTLVHRFRMDAPTEGINGIVSGMSGPERDRFFREWAEKLVMDLALTVARLTNVIDPH